MKLVTGKKSETDIPEEIRLMRTYAEEIYRLMKDGSLDDYLVAKFIDEIEGSGIHVDFLGLPYVTTAILTFIEIEEPKVHIKVVDNTGIKNFVFNLR